MAFKRFTGTLPRATQPRVSIRRRGKLGFNTAAIREYGIGDYSHVVLYYDPSIKTVGVEFTNDASAVGALRVNKTKVQDAYVCAQSFFRHFKIPLNSTRRAELVPSDGDRGFYVFKVPAVAKSKKIGK
jgi:hypothetical protein